MWFIGVEVEQETSAPPPKKNPGSAPAVYRTTHQTAINRPMEHTGETQHTFYVR